MNKLLKKITIHREPQFVNLKFLCLSTILLSASTGVANSKCESFFRSLVSTSSIKTLPAKLIREKLYAVHATNLLPENGVIIADGRGLDVPILRSEIHFALGGLVPAHVGGNWESRKFAVVVPLAELEPQLANLMVFDTIIYGDYKIPSGAVLIIPDNVQTGALPENITIHRYSTGTTLRRAIENVIESKSGWVIKTKYGDGLKNDKAIIEELGININSHLALKEILDQHPNVTFLNGVQTKGDMVSQWSRFLIKYFTMKERLNISTAQLKFETKKFEMFVANVKSDIDILNLNGVSANGYLNFESKFKHLRHFLSLEIELREKYSRSVFNSDPKLWMPQILPLIQDYKKLRELIFSNINNFQKLHHDYINLYAENIAEDLVTLSKKSVINLLKESPEFLIQVEGGLESVYDYFVVKKLAAIGPKNADHEDLLFDIASAFERASKTKYDIDRLLLSMKPRNSESFDYLLKSPKILSILSRKYDIKKFKLIDSFDKINDNLEFMRFIKFPDKISN